VLEARHRPGGRVYTLREPFADGLYAEAGGQAFYPVVPNFAAQYTTEFGLSREPGGRGGLLRAFVLGGTRIVLRPRESVRWPLDLTAEEQRLGLEGIREKFLMPLLDELAGLITPAGWTSDAIERFDSISFAEALRRRGASASAIEILRLADLDYVGEGAERYSAIDMLGQVYNVRAAGRFLKGDFFAIAGGNDLLPRAFASRLGTRIYYGAAVSRITQGPQSVSVEYRQAGEHRQATADYLVCAIPFSVLRTLEILPAFSPAKMRAIRDLAHTSLARTYIQCRRRFWYDQELSGSVATDHATTYFWESTTGQPGPRGIMQGYVMGPHARRFGQLSTDERDSFALTEARRAFPEISGHAETVSSISWDTEPWSRGDYAWLRPGDARALWPHLATPENRVHFAGEHTSTWFLHGTMQGALESGIRASKAIDALP
jgi:monoamine oxidase